MAQTCVLLLGSCTYLGTTKYHSPSNALHSTTVIYNIKNRSSGFSVYLFKAGANSNAENLALSDGTYKITIRNLGDPVKIRTSSSPGSTWYSDIKKSNLRSGESFSLNNKSGGVTFNPVIWDKKNIWLEFTVRNSDPEKIKGLSLVESHSP